MLPHFTLFGLELHSYVLAALLAASTAGALSWAALGRAGWPKGLRAGTLAAMCAAFLLGARLWNLLAAPDSYGPDRPWHTLRLTYLWLVPWKPYRRTCSFSSYIFGTPYI